METLDVGFYTFSFKGGTVQVNGIAFTCLGWIVFYFFYPTHSLVIYFFLDTAVFCNCWFIVRSEGILKKFPVVICIFYQSRTIPYGSVACISCIYMLSVYIPTNSMDVSWSWGKKQIEGFKMLACAC